MNSNDLPQPALSKNQSNPHAEMTSMQSDRTSRNKAPNMLTQLPKWVMPAGVIILATLVYFVLARSFSSGIFSSPIGGITEDATDPYLLGVVFQDALLPLVLLVVLTTRPTFQAFVVGDSSLTHRLLVGSALFVIELVYLVLILYSEIAWVSFGLVVIAAAGLIGGWRWGLALGLMSFFMEGTLDLFDAAIDDYYLIQDNDWWSLLGWFYLTEIPLMAKIWAGIVAGHVGTLVRHFRIGLVLVVITGFFLEAIPSVFFFLVVDADYALDTTVAGGVITAFALLVFMLQVFNTQNQAQLRKVEVNEMALTQAELRALRAQINPHFLFNSLNTIRYFVRTDPDQARSLLLNLSEVFQVALKAGETVSLKEEIGFTKSYLALEQARLDERLEVNWFIQNEDLLQAEIPTLLLQPVVENAVVHGIAPNPDGGRLQIMITGSDEDLIIQVIDDGVGMNEERLALVKDPVVAPDGSIGTLNIQQRLKTLYKNRGDFKVDSAEGRGTTVELRLPLKQHEHYENIDH